MKTLTKDQLLNLAEASAIYSSLNSEREAEIHNSEIGQCCAVATDADPAVCLIRDIIERFKPIVAPEHFDALKAVDIFVLPLHACNAFADADNRTIIIYNGLLRAIEYQLHAAIITSVVKSKLPAIDDIQLKFNSCSFRALALPLHYFRSHTPLPRILEYLEPEDKQRAVFAFEWMVIFILLHELGHIVLKHQLPARNSRKGLWPTLAFFENMNEFKDCEFQADQFAFEAIKPEFRSRLYDSAIAALDIFARWEALSGISCTKHPLIINRLTHMGLLPGARDSDNEPFVEKILNRLRFFMEGHIEDRELSHLPPETMSETAIDTAYDIVGKEQLCRNSFASIFAFYAKLIDEEVFN